MRFSSPLVFSNRGYAARQVFSPDCLIVRAAQAAPAFENWQEESRSIRPLGSVPGKRVRGITPPRTLFSDRVHATLG
jgi:hypothetical protein